MSNPLKLALVIFKEDLPKKSDRWWSQFEVVIASKNLESKVQEHGQTFVNLDDLIEPGSIYEASALAKELSLLKLADGSRLTKSFIYQGYELWWARYHGLFVYFCLPYTQYKKLLAYLKDFSVVYFYQPPYKSLFSHYLKAYGCKPKSLRDPGLKIPTLLSLGIFLQIFFTLLSIPLLMVKRYRLAVSIGDKFDQSRDYDFRMKFIYQELRQRKILFVEFVRSIESWPVVLKHFFVRKRPVIYYEAIAFVGRVLGYLSVGQYRIKRKIKNQVLSLGVNPEARFKILVATHYLRALGNDIWAIRIMKLILRAIGVKVALFTAVTERNFSIALGCKLNQIPTVGILHGAASRYYVTYDFTPGFDGAKMLSVDKYGLWSEGWKEYYLKNSQAYRPEQLYVSGPMRPVEPIRREILEREKTNSGRIRILFISEQLAVPDEVIPYLEALLAKTEGDFVLTLHFRPSRDGFKSWLEKYRPDLLARKDITLSDGELSTAIRNSEVVVGSHSTAVLEALHQYRVPVFFKTKKWGDYFELRNYDTGHSFFAENPEDLVAKIKKARCLSINYLEDLRERYFGDPGKNGSQWAVDQVEKFL